MTDFIQETADAVQDIAKILFRVQYSVDFEPTLGDNARMIRHIIDNLFPSLQGDDKEEVQFKALRQMEGGK
jgi:hypothetical protein